MPIYGYDKKTDYQKLMDDAVKAGDYARAAIYEQQRNEKIKGEGLSQYGTTNQYASYLPGANVGAKFENPYKADLDAALSRMQDRGAFAKGYLREADRTMEDALTQYGTMTGGLPSTQAVAAASQAADYYKSQLPEKLNDLDRQNASLLLSAGSQAQSEYQTMISQALSRWSQLGYADGGVSDILGVAVGTPTSDQSYINWQKGQQDKSDAYTMAMTLIQAGQMPNADTLAAAGISAADAQSLLGAYTQPSYSGGSSSGRGSSGKSTAGGSSSGKNSGKALSGDQWEELEGLYETGKRTGDMSAYERKLLALTHQEYDVGKFKAYIEEAYWEGPLPPTNENILSLGFGSLSAERILELLDQGVIGSKVVDGREVLYRIGNSPVPQDYRGNASSKYAGLFP